ncbi:MAG: DUF1614 domain-containing protein [Planctomycetaceae bacterium]|nr:DUF1614 domain-containing protein [Planctomycetales bacterium]MCB9874127.1 DUF1614 domain-containing protein [Planctomycetaceae bacterium]MCB9940580.1 DUF1614 domain-containing protein [Planctomycetaceae bacterium]
MVSRRGLLAERFPQLGCLIAAVVAVTMCIWPFVLVNAMQMALTKLHLHSIVGFGVMIGIVAGSFVNFPLHRLEREVEQVEAPGRWHRWLGRVPLVRRTKTETIIAVNLGGCLIPVALACFELLIVAINAPRAMWAIVVASVANIIVCYRVARPIQGLGIAMPALLPPAVSVGVTWLLLMSSDYDPVRAPVAFIAGIAGPLIGADLLHLRDISRISVGVLSIGGAGTFDGIVLSGLLAALVA